jgi:tetratricopeptide (TPR) repeat protein
MVRMHLVGVILALGALSLRAGDRRSQNAVQPPLPHCGEIYAAPFEDKSDAWPRQCLDHGQRLYVHKHQGLGFDILDSESEACFVPDAEYQLLDSLIDQVEKQIQYKPRLQDAQQRLDQARMISKTISDTLAQNGFGLYIPTDTLSDALLDRSISSGSPRHIFDCDTGSFIFLTVADSLKAPVSLVDITLPSGAGHNYVQWDLDGLRPLNWDMNGRAECQTPKGLPAYQGKPMSRQHTLGYAMTLRAQIWENRQRYDRAVSDYKTAMRLYPEGPTSYNNFAWLIATKEIPNRKDFLADALTAALRSTSIDDSANYLDTLACVYALQGDLKKAIKVESDVLKKSPSNPAFLARLSLFNSQKDCTGAK